MIKIGDEIVVTVIHTSSGSVKLGIQAPRDVRVLRAELDRLTDSQPSMVEAPDAAAEGPVFSAEIFLKQFNVDYVAELEDQALKCLAK
jgi:carbon storage regulator CsrA